MTHRTQATILLALAAVTFLAWGIHYAGFDLWWDEIDSLTEYALVDFATTVTKYPYPNNHIFFNLVTNLVTRWWGVRDVYEIMDRVFVLRWLQWAISLGTVGYVYLAARRHFGPIAGALAAVLLVTSLPFLNFAMQLRGYGLSMFFVAGLVFHCGVGRRVSVRHICITAAYCFGLLYTVPSNAYFVLALGLFVGVRFVAGIRRERATPLPDTDASLTFAGGVTGDQTERPGLVARWIRNGDLWLLVAIGLGTLAAFLAYMPVLDQVLGNRFVTDSPSDRGFVLTTRLPGVWRHFLSNRYLLLLLVLPGLYRAIRYKCMDGRNTIFTLLALLLLPFVFSFLRNDLPFERTFIHLAPVFAILLAATTQLGLLGVPARLAGAAAWLPAIIALYSIGTLATTHVQLQRRLSEDLTRNVREQNIFANFYQSNGYQPLEVCRVLAKELALRPGLVLLANELDRVAWTFYLQKLDIPSYALAQFVAEADPPNTHGGVFQVSQGRQGERVFLQWYFRLPDDFAEAERLTPLMIYTRAYDPADQMYVITGFRDLIGNVLRDSYPEFSSKAVAVPGDFGLYYLESRTASP